MSGSPLRLRRTTPDRGFASALAADEAEPSHERRDPSPASSGCSPGAICARAGARASSRSSPASRSSASCSASRRLIIVLSVMNGFRKELLDKIVGINGHIFIAADRRAADRLRRGRRAGREGRRASAGPSRWSRARPSPPRPTTAAACSCAACAARTSGGSRRSPAISARAPSAASTSGGVAIGRRLAEHLVAAGRRHDHARRPRRAPRRRSARRRGSRAIRSPRSSSSACPSSTPPSSTCRSRRRRPISTATDDVTVDRGLPRRRRPGRRGAPGDRDGGRAAGAPDRLAPAQPHLLRRARGRAQRDVHHPHLIVLVAALQHHLRA